MYVEAAMALFSAVFEKEAKKRQTKDIMNAVEKSTNIIIDTIRTRDLNHFKSRLENFSQEYERALLTDIGEDKEPTDPNHPQLQFFIPLENQINQLKTEVKWYFQHQDMNFFVNNVYPIFLHAVALEVEVLSEMRRRFKDYSKDYIILKHCFEYFLDTHHRVQQFIYEQATNLLVMTEYYRKMVSNYAVVHDLNSLMKIRNDVENKRYRLELMLNHNFEVNGLDGDHIYSSIKFDRCKYFDLKEHIVIFEGKNEKKLILAVNNHDGNNSNPSILKDATDIPKGSKTTFEVKFYSEKRDRKLEIVIWEIDNIKRTIIERAKRLIEYDIAANSSDEFISVQQEYIKQKTDSIIRYELYWHDYEEKNLLISEYNVDYIAPETPWYPEGLPEAQYLPFITYSSWGYRCSERHIKFILDKDLRTSQVLLANDHKHESVTPSITYDLIMKKITGIGRIGHMIIPIWQDIPEWTSLNVRFEATLCTDKDIGRVVELKIYELAVDIKRDRFAVVKSDSSGKIKIGDQWVHLYVECKKSSVHDIRCEIYWFDNENVDLQVRGAKVTYF